LLSGPDLSRETRSRRGYRCGRIFGPRGRGMRAPRPGLAQVRSWTQHCGADQLALAQAVQRLLGLVERKDGGVRLNVGVRGGLEEVGAVLAGQIGDRHDLPLAPE